MLIGPAVENLRYKFGPVIDLNATWRAAFRANGANHGNDGFAADALVNPDSQAFARIGIDERQCAQFAPVVQLVTDEVHAPALVPCSWSWRPVTLHCRAVAARPSLEER